MNHLLIVGAFLAVCMSTLAQDSPKKDKEAWHRSEFPRPQMRNETRLCGRRNKASSWVCDPANIISYEEANQLDVLIGQTRNGTKCPCSEWECIRNKLGYTISVALVPAIETDKDADDDVHTRLNDGKLFASILEIRRWNYGRCEEDIVIFYSLNDNVLYTSVGGTAFKVLNHNLITEITMEASNYFGPNRDIARGLRHIISGYRNVFLGRYYSTKQGGGGGPRSGQQTAGGAQAIQSQTFMITSLAAVTLTALLYTQH
ncbi:unnamed protein product [Owenia fusiformis]|uniref:Uncharacterized protein n=1 Tax=Owenia fusiformis TaxID=6347 RepID=A0A8S4Q3I4_OWEFU|nr:unnamed protein product [Owenia fusiformis]